MNVFKRLNRKIIRDKIELEDRKNWMQFLVVIVGQACSLKCKDCSNFSPYAPMDMKKYQFEDIKKSLGIIFDNMGGIVKLQLQGGEPFLCDYLDELIDWLYNTGKVDEITLTTNGTIIPNNKVLKALKECKVQVSISDYHVIKRERLSEVLKKLSEKQILYSVYEFADGRGTWRALGGSDSPRENNGTIVKERFDSCPFKWCMTLEKNILGYCSRSVIAQRVQKFEAQPGDYVDLWNTEDLHDVLIRYCFWYRGGHIMEACRYCNPLGGEIPAGLQLKD